MKQSVFFEEWRKCLQEHYKDVVRRQDKLTERTLVPVLHRVGFTDDELRTLYIEATMRADQMPDDFLPSLPDTLVQPSPQVTADEPLTFTPHPAECSCPACMDQVDLLRHDPEGQPLNPEQIVEKIEIEKHTTAKRQSKTRS